ncbi:MFS transporter small subunit [Mesorhizobium sp. CCNWLW176]
MTRRHVDNRLVVKLILAWGFVGIPLLFGILQTLTNVMNLFR